ILSDCSGVVIARLTNVTPGAANVAILINGGGVVAAAVSGLGDGCDRIHIALLIDAGAVCVRIVSVSALDDGSVLGKATVLHDARSVVSARLGERRSCAAVLVDAGVV